MLKDLLYHVRFSLLLSLVTVGIVLYVLGVNAVVALVTLTLIEITFSFDNAIINAKILSTMSRFWRQIFLTVGIVIAVIGMRLIFPIVLIMLTAGLGFTTTLDLAFNHPAEYAERVELAHPAISSFGGTFLLMLALVFFMADNKRPWIKLIERPVARIGSLWLAAGVTAVALLVVSLVPANHHPTTTLLWGGVALALFLIIHFLTGQLPRLLRRPGASKKPLTGLAAFFSFIYLEVLDASFSLDAVLGAFAVTNDVILIAAGLGIGAFFVRSLTVYMVKRRTLNSFAYIEHGAHYAILALAISLFVSLFVSVPSSLIGVGGLIIIGLSLVASIRARRHTR